MKTAAQLGQGATVPKYFLKDIYLIKLTQKMFRWTPRPKASEIFQAKIF